MYDVMQACLGRRHVRCNEVMQALVRKQKTKEKPHAWRDDPSLDSHFIFMPPNASEAAERNQKRGESQKNQTKSWLK